MGSSYRNRTNWSPKSKQHFITLMVPPLTQKIKRKRKNSKCVSWQNENVKLHTSFLSKKEIMYLHLQLQSYSWVYHLFNQLFYSKKHRLTRLYLLLAANARQCFCKIIVLSRSCTYRLRYLWPRNVFCISTTPAVTTRSRFISNSWSCASWKSIEIGKLTHKLEVINE